MGRQEKFVHFAGRVKTKENHSLKKTVLETWEEPFWTQQESRAGKANSRGLNNNKYESRPTGLSLVLRECRFLSLFFFLAASVKSASCFEKLVWGLESTNEFVCMNILTSSYNNIFLLYTRKQRRGKDETSSVRFPPSFLSAACKCLNTSGQCETSLWDNNHMQQWPTARSCKARLGTAGEKKCGEKNVNSSVMYKHAHSGMKYRNTCMSFHSRHTWYDYSILHAYRTSYMKTYRFMGQ